MRSLSILLGWVVLTTSAGAGNWYVDAVNGRDANPGTTPALAWQTLTHACDTVPVPPMGSTEVIHIAPGIYSQVLGEVFPLHPRDGFQLVGTAGAANTFVDGGGSGVLIAASITHVSDYYTGPLTLLAGLTLRNADEGISLVGGNGDLYMNCRDLRIEHMNAIGVHALSTDLPNSGRAHVTLQRVEIDSCATGICIWNDSTWATIPACVDLWDCAITNCSAYGIEQHDQGSGTTLTAHRIRVVANGADGVRITQQNLFGTSTTLASFYDSLIAGNVGSGLYSTAPAPWIIRTYLQVDVVRCTIAHNGGSGLDAYYPMGSGTVFTTNLRSSILYGNADDVRENPSNPSIVDPAWNDVGDGDFAGFSGNFSANPLFRDVAARNWRLVWGSPCIDTGDPYTREGVIDLMNAGRLVDGNLDLVERSDVGACEFTPLTLVETPRVTTSVTLELWGPTGGNAMLVASLGPTLPAPIPTVFGDLDLDRTVVRCLGWTSVASGPPAVRTLSLRSDPAFAGLMVSVQALTTSTVGTSAQAFTNPVTFTIQP